MDPIHVLGDYTRQGVSVEQELEPLVKYVAHVETPRNILTPAHKQGVLLAEWKTPYKAVLCPQADQQGLAITPDENTLFIETTHRTPKEVAQTIAELYTQIKPF